MTNAIDVVLQYLKNGNARATVLHNNRTVALKDGPPSSAKELLNSVMAEGCAAHRVGNWYDLTHIELNDAAKAALG